MLKYITEELYLHSAVPMWPRLSLRLRPSSGCVRACCRGKTVASAFPLLGLASMLDEEVSPLLPPAPPPHIKTPPPQSNDRDCDVTVTNSKTGVEDEDEDEDEGRRWNGEEGAVRLHTLTHAHAMLLASRLHARRYWLLEATSSAKM